MKQKFYAKEYATPFMDMLDDFLEANGVHLPNSDKEMLENGCDIESKENRAVLYGTDYDEILNSLAEMFANLVREIRPDIEVNEYDYGDSIISPFEKNPVDVSIVKSPIYECYEKREGGFNLFTVFYSEEQVDEFVSTAGSRIMSQSGINELKKKIVNNGVATNVWNLIYEDTLKIPYKAKPSEIDNSKINKNCSVDELRRCMRAYLDFVYDYKPWFELGVKDYGELVYMHSDGSFAKLTAVTGSDGYPDILNERGESVFTYSNEMEMSEDEINEIRGIEFELDRF